MNQVVFLEPNRLNAVPFTTSKVIAECAGVKHHTVTRLIQKHENDFKDFGILRFKIEEINGRGQPAKTYCLNEEQATLLITYLKNTSPVRAFKKEFVRQFYAMRTELQKRQIEREALKLIRRSLTDTVKEVGGEPWAYKNYTDLACKSVVGQTAAQLRKNRDAPKTAKAIEYMTADEIHAVAERQGLISSLLGLGFDYQDVKTILAGK